MKCPFRYVITQNTITKNEENEIRYWAELQEYADCYKENCLAYNSEKKICRKLEKEVEK